MVRKTSTEIKQFAQDMLIDALGSALELVWSNKVDGYKEKDPDHSKLLCQLQYQIGRIEKLFGYEPGTHKW